ncbi:hypothetical protein EJ04DRAFT_581246 [Polyplosphaeria fusca]|uniref:Ankyrin n=1 Tax=Polyplosphaeria fusca TaxID=682080 RepID=A0A9P4QPG4_9PLEO|nr:hypothetical protein EJ04DRAFT_581246 [Polyplosphaeria fusca]
MQNTGSLNAPPRASAFWTRIRSNFITSSAKNIKEQEEQQATKEPVFFDLTKLPADILPILVHHIVLDHIPHPRRSCHSLHTLLSLRTVCQSFNTELLYSLSTLLTLPNLSLYHRALSFSSSPHSTSTTSPLLSPPPSLAISLLTSALTNSARSTYNRQIACPMSRRINTCLCFAQVLANDFSRSMKRDLLRVICEGVASGGKGWKGVDGRMSARDEVCVAWLLARPWVGGAVEGVWRSARMSVFGDGVVFAAVGGVEGGLGPGPRVMERAVESGQGRVVEVLLLGAEERRLGMSDQTKRWLFRWYVVRAVKGGDVGVLRLLMNFFCPAQFSGAGEYREYMLALHHVALMYAVRFSQAALVEFLLERGADVDRLDERGVSAFGLARARGFAKIEELLVQAGAKDLGCGENVDEETVDEKWYRMYMPSICERWR